MLIMFEFTFLSISYKLSSVSSINYGFIMFQFFYGSDICVVMLRCTTLLNGDLLNQFDIYYYQTSSSESGGMQVTISSKRGTVIIFLFDIIIVNIACDGLKLFTVARI